MTTTVYITRHGQTEWNVQKRMQGHQDSPLTPLGVQQAEWLGKSLQDVHLDAVYASSSPRALRTAEIIRGSGRFRLPPMMNSERLTSASGKAGRPVSWRSSTRSSTSCSGVIRRCSVSRAARPSPPCRERALGKLRELIDRHEGGTILIATHTVVVKVLMAYFEGRSMEKLWDLPYIHPTCLCRIDITNGVPEIVLHGDTSHYVTAHGELES